MIESAYRVGIGLSLASVVAFGGNVFGAAVAAAEPSDDVVWDIEAYDDCMNKTVSDPNQCCVDSGGVPTDEPLGDRKGQKCQAPPAQAEASGQTVPPGILAPIGYRPAL